MHKHIVYRVTIVYNTLTVFKQAARKNTLCEHYLAIATLAVHEYFASGCSTRFAQIKNRPRKGPAVKPQKCLYYAFSADFFFLRFCKRIKIIRNTIPPKIATMVGMNHSEYKICCQVLADTRTRMDTGFP